MSKANVFSDLYEKYGWRYECKGVGDTLTERIAFKIVGESTLFVLTAPAAMYFWNAVSAVIVEGKQQVQDFETVLKNLAESKRLLCGEIVAKTDGWYDTLKGYITPARVASSAANQQCFVLEEAEIKMKRELNEQVGEQVNGILDYIVSMFKGGFIEKVSASTGAVILQQFLKYRHDIVCLFASMWYKLWNTIMNKITEKDMVCKFIADGDLPAFQPNLKL